MKYCVTYQTERSERIQKSIVEETNMNFRRVDDNELADMAVNIANLLAGSELSAIDINVRTALIASLGTLPAELQAQTYEAVVLEDQRKAKVDQRNATHDKLELW